jgi:hypothetical protein
MSIHISTYFFGPSEPKMRRWIDYMTHLGGGLPLNTFGHDFLDLWDEQIIVIDDFLYVGTNLDMTLSLYYLLELNGVTLVRQITLHFFFKF